MPRPPLPASAKRVKVATIRLTEQEEKHLIKFYGSAVKGLRHLIRMDLGKRQTSDARDEKEDLV